VPSFRVVKKIIHFCFFLFCLGISLEVFCSNVDMVRNLNQDFLIYRSEYKSLLPVTGKSSDVNVVYLKIPASEIVNHKIYIQSKKDVYIYVNGKMARHYAKGVIWFDVKVYVAKNFDKDHIFLSIFTPNAINSLTVDLFRNSAKNLPSSNTENIESQSIDFLSTSSEKKDKYIIGVILSLITFILLKTLVPNIYHRIFKWQVDMGSLMDRSSSKLTYFQNESIFIFLFISILAGIYIYVFLDKDTYISGYKVFSSTHGAALFTYGLVATFLLFSFKYIIYRLVSYVFGVAAFSKILINEFSKTIFQAILFIYPIYFLVHSPYYQLESDSMLKFVYPIVLVLSLFVLKELYYFYKVFNFNKFYIIAYICICDLFPTCVFLKILSQSEFI